MNTTTDYKYKAFISYSGAADQKLVNCSAISIAEFRTAILPLQSDAGFSRQNRLPENPELLKFGRSRAAKQSLYAKPALRLIL